MSTKPQSPPIAASPDPLIDEVRDVRRALSDAHGNDVNRLWEHLQRVQRDSAARVVRRPPEDPRENQARTG